MDKKVFLSKLTREDVHKMVSWGKHLDSRFYHYNFDLTTEHGFNLWYKSKKKIFYRKIYKVEDEFNNMVGFITIKNINWPTRTAEMGIVFNPKILNQGYGTLGLKLILKEFFEVLNMNRLYLRVAGFNDRAYKSYIKSGFVEFKKTEEPFENQKLNNLINRQYEDFYICEDILYSEYIYMHVTKKMYLEMIKG